MSAQKNTSYVRAVIGWIKFIATLLLLAGIILFITSLFNADRKRDDQRMAAISAYVKKYPYLSPIIVTGNSGLDYNNTNKKTLYLMKVYVTGYERGKWVGFNGSRQDDIRTFEVAIDEVYKDSDTEKVDAIFKLYKAAYETGQAEGSRLRALRR